MIDILDNSRKNNRKIEEISAGFLYAGMLLSLFEPWLHNFVGESFEMGRIIWSVLVIIISIIIAKRMEIVAKIRRILYIIFFIAFNLIILFFLGWSFKFYSILFLLFFYLSLRFTLYGKVINQRDRSFNKDFTIFVFIMLLSVYYSVVGKLNVDYTNIILFFGSGISLSIYFNFELIDKTKKQNLMALVAGIFAITAFLFSLLVRYGQNLGDKLGVLLSLFYSKAVDIFMFFFKYILILITPLVKLYQKIVIWFFMGDKPPPEREGKALFEYMKKIEEMREGPIKEFNPPFWIFYFLLGIFIFLISIKLIRLAVEKEEEGVSEERESIFSLDQLKEDIVQFFPDIKEQFKSKHIYDKSTDMIIIREIYYKFLLKFKDIKLKKKGETPNKYQTHLKKRIGEDGKSIGDLTQAYNRARYRKKLAPDDLVRVESAWKSLGDES